jgi:predicted enzyme related to lactoylglutathione lyase
MAAYGFQYITFHVSDVEAALTACVADGAKTIVPVSIHSPACRMAMVSDPDGNCVELSEGVPWEPISDSEFSELTGLIR